MKIEIEIKDEYLWSIKYILMVLFIIIWILYVYFFQWGNQSIYLMIATIFAIYMAINLWANDVANNMWPAVWSKAISIWAAIIIAGIFEASWALIAGWDVVDTIKWWIINKDLIETPKQFISIMLATLLWAAIWINIATFFKAPVSTTNAIIWWLVWAGITAVWTEIVKWSKIWEIVSSWVISLLMWWFIAVWLFISIRKTILKKEDKWEAAKRWVPVYVGIMMAIFSMYLILKWLKPVINSNEMVKELLTPNTAIIIWLIIWLSAYLLLIIIYQKHKKNFFKDKKKFVNKLFNFPLIFAVALLSFAHGSNDVANAIWPLAAIYDTVTNIDWAELAKSAWVPIWIMLIWGIWLSIWLAVFWARLIKTVWNEITKLDQIRAFCVALAAASTVIVASQLWLPVSSTQIALWAVFWIGLFRQHITTKKWSNKQKIDKSMMKWILLSWVVTLPVAWAIASVTYFIIMKI